MFIDILLLIGIVIVFSMCIKKAIQIIKAVKLFLKMKKEDNAW